ncbi:MAG: YjbH domain-containing protein, partial [Pseudomonadota bacterium]
MKKTAQGIAYLALLTTSLSSGVLAEGIGGLSQAIDTPRAASGVADDLTILFDYREDYRALSFGFQPSDRVEVGVSFPTYDDEDGSGSSSGNELSLGLRFLNEGAYVPSLTVGLVGLGSDDRGTGEYILASKTIGPVQISGGLGWGRYADQTIVDRGEDDGTFRTDHLFEGESEPFANIVWDTGFNGLIAAAEYSGVAGLEEDDTFAASLSYEVLDGLRITGLVNNQGDAGLRLEFSANPRLPFVQTDIGRGPHPYAENRPARAGQPQPNEAQVFAVLTERLEKENIQIDRFAMRGDTIDVTASSNTDPVFARITGRVARVLSAVAPANITTFRVTQNTGAFDSNVIVLDRAGLDAAVGKPNAAELAWDATSFDTSPRNRPAALGETAFEPGFSYGFAPVFRADFITS